MAEIDEAIELSEYQATWPRALRYSAEKADFVDTLLKEALAAQ